MPANDPLRRAPLKRAGLALLAALACTAPAAAQTLNIADTLTYINERCEGSGLTDGVVAVNTGHITASGALLSLQYDQHLPNSGIAATHVASSFDLRRVDIEKSLGLGRAGYLVKFNCGVRNCISTLKHKHGSSDTYNEKYGTRGETSSTEISCREPDGVVNAFKHLQQLLGGRITDPIDPFAN